MTATDTSPVTPNVRSRRPRAASLVAEIGGAALFGAGAATLAYGAFGVSGPIALLAVGFVAFLVIVLLVELERGARRAPVEVDLTAEEGTPLETESDEVPNLHSVSDDDASDDVPVRRRRFKAADAVELLVAAVGAAAAAELLRIVLRMRSLVGVAIWWYVFFIGLYFLLGRDRSDTETAIDRVVTVLVVSAGIVVASVLTWMIVFVVTKGLSKLTGSFFTEDLSKTGPLNPGGGAKHAILGTLEQVGIATVIVVPIGILTAVYLHEIQGRLAPPVRFIVDAMSGLPSIVAGLLIFTVWIQRHGYSGVGGSAALVVLMLPFMTRATEEILRTVPNGLREGALALGAPQWRLIQRVVLPTAIAGVVTAAMLAVARAVGETAPMLLTAFGADTTVTNPNHGPQSDLPLFVWKLIREPDKTQQARAWTGALILVMLVFVFFVTARIVSSRGMRKLKGAR